MIVARILRMLPAIGLNDQPSSLTNEISDERTDRLLAAELSAVQLPGSKDGPKLALGVGKFAPQPLGFGESRLIVTSHALTLPPLRGSLPLPQGERK